MLIQIPSGKQPRNCGKSQLLMGKLTILTWPFSIAMLVITRGYIEWENPGEKTLNM